MLVAPQCTIDCSRRPAPTHARSLPTTASSSKPHAGTPNFTWTSAGKPRPNGRRGPQPSGWRIMAVRSAMSARRWTGVALTAAALPLWCQLSLLDECRGRVEQALAHVAPGSNRDTRYQMQLEAALGLSLFHTKGPVRETVAAWTRALAIADRLEDTEYQLRALWGLWSHRMSSAEYRDALAFAQRFRRLAARRSDPADQLIADRMIGTVLRYLGDLTNARRHIERMLSRYVDAPHQSHPIRFVWDQRVAGEMILALILWLQGFPDQAMRTAQRTIESARARDHTISLCYALSTAVCPVALWIGDLAAAERYLSMLLDHSTKFAMAVWQAGGQIGRA